MLTLTRLSLYLPPVILRGRGGGIGRRAGFKIRFLRKCEFDSRPRHHITALAPRHHNLFLVINKLGIDNLQVF
jgi:hypothetical protein